MNVSELLEGATESWIADEPDDDASRLQEVVAKRILQRVRSNAARVWKPTDVGDVLIEGLITIGFDWSQDSRLELIKTYLVQTYDTARQILPARLREF